MRRIRVGDDAGDVVRAGLGRIRERFEVPETFPPEVIAAAEAATRREWRAGRVDLTGIRFATIDPESSVDLDQAFAVERDGDDIVLRYAIADVGAFVDPGDVIDAEAWRRGVTIYLPGFRARLYPPQLSEAAASLLPDGERPAVVFTVRIAPDGTASMDSAVRAIVASRAKLAYTAVTADDLPPELEELATRVVAAEHARGAIRIEAPEQIVERAGDDYRVVYRPRLWSEEWSSAMSLATNLAAATVLIEARTGLFRVLRAPEPADIARLRHAAAALDIAWAREETLADVERRLDQSNPKHAAFVFAIRRVGGGADYAPYRDGVVPWHAAVAASYAHVTAPLRRLADRYVIDALVAVCSGEPVPPYAEDAFARLPDVMDRAEAQAARVERAVVDAVEAVVLRDRVGATFEAVVTDTDDRGARIQLCDPAVIARLRTDRLEPGDRIRVRLVAADVEQPSLAFERVA